MTASLGIPQPRGMAHRVAVRAQGAGGGVDLLDAAMPEIAALVDHVVVRRAPRSAAAGRAGGAWQAAGGPGGRRRCRRRWSRRAGSRGRRPRRPGRRAPSVLRGEGSQLAQRLGKLASCRASAGCGPTPRRSSSASQSRPGRSPRVSASGAPTATTTSPSELQLGGHLRAPSPARRRSPQSRIGGSGVRTSSSIASWSEPCMGTTPQ